MGAITVPAQCGGPRRLEAADAAGARHADADSPDAWRSWTARTGGPGSAGSLTVSLDAPIGRLYARMARAESRAAARGLRGGHASCSCWSALGVAVPDHPGRRRCSSASLLARSITYAVHELFVGTERVQRGDFAHRIRIDSGDQLGELAGVLQPHERAASSTCCTCSGRSSGSTTNCASPAKSRGRCCRRHRRSFAGMTRRGPLRAGARSRAATTTTSSTSARAGWA